jgi:hypothetical protein
LNEVHSTKCRLRNVTFNNDSTNSVSQFEELKRKSKYFLSKIIPKEAYTKNMDDQSEAEDYYFS